MKKIPAKGNGKGLQHIKDLLPDPQNARRHNPANIGMIGDSLQEVGAARSIVIDEKGMVLAGNGVLEAAGAVGITKLQVVDADGETIIAVRRSGLTAKQKKRLALFDNRTAELADWDGQVIADLLAEDEAILKGMFDADLLRKLIGNNGGPEDPGPQLDNAEELRQKWGVETGQLWRLGEHRLICGDCTDRAVVERVMGGEKAQAIITDPPYCSGGFQEAGKKSGSIGTRGDEMIANDTLSTRGYIALMKSAVNMIPIGVAYVFTDWRMWINLFDVMESSGFGVRQMIVWDKGTPGMGRGWRSQHELIMAAMKVTQPFDPHKAQGNVISCQRTGNINHATEKPVELIETILDVTDMALTVYDPFLGSGTTLIACERLGRKCRAVEISPAYCAVAIQRWVDMTGKQPELINVQPQP